MFTYPLNIGLIAETKLPPDKRVVLSPKQCAAIQQAHPELKFWVQSSEIRTFSNQEYLNEGIQVVDDLNHCELLLGVKEVAVNALIPNKTYMFFSHTFKKQAANKALLRAILDKHIRLIDWELLTDESERRLIGFGKYAGIVGAYNGLLAWGLLKNSFSLKPANRLFDRSEMRKELKKVRLPNNFKLVTTGRGRVASGILEVLRDLGMREVRALDFLMQTFNEPVFTSLGVQDYVRRLDGRVFRNADFYANPEQFESAFTPFTKVAHLYISGHYWEKGSPIFFDKHDVQAPDFSVELVADVSCDVEGPIATTLRTSTIAEPLYGYNRFTGDEVKFGSTNSVGVMAVDNLPCELPRDASEDFGKEFISNILPHFFNGDAESVLNKATETEGGTLTSDFKYLSDYVGLVV